MTVNPRNVIGAAGILAALAVIVMYAAEGYRSAMPLTLVASILSTAYFFSRSPVSIRALMMDRKDLVAVGILLVTMAPLYWWRLYSVPWQINTDEVTIMQMARNVAFAPGTDLLGISPVAGLPHGVFVFVGRLAAAIGGISLYHSRLVHSTLGIVCVLLAYALFRQLMMPVKALSLAILVGANHALFAISRMAMRENTSLLFELLALWLLTRGLQKRSRSEVFLGGVSAGLAFYVYFPGRIAVVIGLGVIVGVGIVAASREMLRLAVRYTAIFLLGWAMAASPVLIASGRHAKDAYAYTRQQFLFYPEGRALQQMWTGQPTPRGAWVGNIKNGLRMFNTGEHDQGYIYPNYKHAFVDPLTGVLLWIGVAIVSVRLVRRRKLILTDSKDSAAVLGDLTAMLGFLAIYLSSAFLITKAPNYTRLLIILPFVAYLAGTAMWEIAGWIARRFQSKSNGTASAQGTVLAYACVAVIGMWNLSLFNDFARTGVREGNDVGSTGRYVEARSSAPAYTWVLAADKTHPYYSWGEAWQWKVWMGFFAGPGQTAEVSAVADLPSLQIPGDFTVFIANPDWRFSEQAFRARFPLYEVRRLTPDSRLLAIDVRQLR